MSFSKTRLAFLLTLLSISNAWCEARRGDALFQKATFAAGCFWCIQASLDATPGILKTTVGYTGGTLNNPSYKQVSSGQTGHTEAIEVLFDPQKVSYDKLLEIFWDNINPTTPNQQFADVGSQYHTVIYYHSEGQRLKAEKSKEQINKSGRFDIPVVTDIKPATAFWPAEEYHQKYYLKNPEAYQMYKDHSGRKEFLKHPQTTR